MNGSQTPFKADALQALRRFREEVEQGKFPTDSESYH